MQTVVPRAPRRPWLKPLNALQRWSASQPMPADDVSSSLPAEATPAEPAQRSSDHTEGAPVDLSFTPAFSGDLGNDETQPAILWRGPTEEAADAPDLPPPDNLAPDPLEARDLAALAHSAHRPDPAQAQTPTKPTRPLTPLTPTSSAGVRPTPTGGQALLDQRLAAALSEAQRRSALGALVRLGVSRLDEVGDAYGEVAVAQVLQHLGRRLSQLLDQVAPQATVHTVGDGMLVVLPRVERSTAAEALVRQMLDSLGRPITLKGQSLAVHGHAGLAIFPHDGDQPATLRRAAEVAWHQARLRGRHAYQFYARELENRALRRLALEARLRQAIMADELQLAFQPRAEVRTGALSGAEVVPVWAGENDSEPAWQGSELLMLADESGLGEALAHWAVRKTCHHLKTWLAAGLAVPQLSVPILPSPLKQDRLVQTLLREVRGSGLDPAAITLLLRPVAPLAAQTPQRLGRELCSVMPRLNAFTEAGFRLALDGVATSGCSLSALAQLPLAELRLDCQALLPIDDTQGTLRGAIVALGHRLGLRVTASGVLDDAQLDQLREAGCDDFQGPLLSDALDAATWLEVLSRTQHPGG